MDNLVGPLLGTLCGGFFFLLFVGLGVFLIYRTQQSKKKAQVSQNWPSTPGQITDSHVSRSAKYRFGWRYHHILRYPGGVHLPGRWGDVQRA